MDLELVAASALYLGAAFNNYLTVYRHYHNKSSRDSSVRKRTRKRGQRRCWMEDIHHERSRITLNDCLEKLQTDPTGQYFINMSATDFEYLIQKISPIVQRQDTHWRESIPAKIRLAVTLRYLATGDSYSTLHKFFKISTSSVSNIVPEVCNAINTVLKNVMRVPTIPEQWLEKSKGFSFPNCLGALDGKQILIHPAICSEEDKNRSSIIILALIDSDYNFLHAEILSQNNQDIFNKSKLNQICNCNTNLPENSGGIPFVFLSDATFPLSNRIIKPFPGNYPTESPEYNFNQLLKQSHAVSESAFGILNSIFKVLTTPIAIEPKKCEIVIRSCILLHNFLIRSELSKDIYCPSGLADSYIEGNLVSHGSWRLDSPGNILPLQPFPCTLDSEAVQMRISFKDYILRNTIKV